MEFPDLGKHCKLEGCNRLDFLPVKCQGCSEIFCLDHYNYEKHKCPTAPKNNRQVPTCPMCDKPVPFDKDKPLDQIVSEHIDRDCDSKAAARKRKKKKEGTCCAPKCKVRELIELKCDSCSKRVCLKHRHPNDHNCVFLKNNGLNDKLAMEKAIAMSLTETPGSRSGLDEARMKQQETMDQALAHRLHRQELQMRERAARERQRHQQSQREQSNCAIS